MVRRENSAKGDQSGSPAVISHRQSQLILHTNNIVIQKKE